MSYSAAHSNPITVVWIDDQVEQLEDLVGLMENAGDFQVNGLFSDPENSLDYILEENPDIALVDVDMPEISGLDLTPRLKALSPHTQTVIVSVHAEKYIIREALKRGASGFMAKSDAGDQLLQVLRAVNRGEVPVFSTTVEKALKG